MSDRTQAKRSGAYYKRTAFSVVSHGLLIVCAVTFLVPFLAMLAISIKPETEIFVKPFSFFGSHFDFSNYTRAWNFFPFGRYLVNSVLIGVATTALAALTSCLAAYAFSRIRWKGRDLLFTLYLGTLMIPQQATVIPLYIIMRHLGWYDTYMALIVPPAFTAFGTFLMRQYFLTIPYEIEEAGRIDGCNTLGLFWRLILPMSGAGVSTLAIFTFITSWKNFLWPLIMTSTDRAKTLPLGIYMFDGQYGMDWSGLMAATAIAIIPSFFIYLLFQKNLVEGISMTGMGGK